MELEFLKCFEIDRIILKNYPAVKVPLGLSGIFFDRSRHTESVTRIERLKL